MTNQQNTEPVDPDDSDRASEEIGLAGIPDIYEDVPEFDNAPWADAELPSQDDEATEDGSQAEEVTE